MIASVDTISRISAQAEALLDQLVSLGLYGTSRGEAMARLVEDKLVELLAAGVVTKPGKSSVVGFKIAQVK